MARRRRSAAETEELYIKGSSTFSTAVNEMVSLAKSKKLVMAAFYFLVTLVIPFGMVIVGWWIGSMGR